MSLSAALNSILTNKNVCFLCYRSVTEDTLVRVQDEINVKLNKCLENKALSDILRFVIGTVVDEYPDFPSSLTTLCVMCTKSVVNSYIFKQNSLESIKNLNNALNSLLDTLEYTTKQENCKSLYLYFNLNDCTTTKIYYDDSKPKPTVQEALNRFQKLDELPLDFKPKRKYKKDNSRFGKCTGDGRVECNYCNRYYATFRTLRMHFYQAHTVRARKYKCEHCDRAFRNEELLEEHVYNNHQEAICSHCGKMYENRRVLKNHEFFHHNRYYTIVCSDCGRCYKTDSSYKTHKLNKVCEQKFKTKRQDYNYICDYCNKKYVHKMSLQKHIKYLHGNYGLHICKWCGKKCTSNSQLTAHIVKHTRERKFKCESCGGFFVTKEALLYHTRLHTGERPYDCSQCEEKFLSASRRADHKRRAHKTAEFECNVCDSTFGTVYYLQKHMKVHSAQPHS